MTDKATRKFQKELNSGAVSLVLLSVLQRHGQPLYGYEIARSLAASCGGELPMNQAAIYPVLRSLEKQQLLRSKLQPSDAGPPRRYYELTAAGKRALEEWKRAWQNTKQFVDSMLEYQDDHEATGTCGPLPRGAGTSGKATSRRRS